MSLVNDDTINIIGYIGTIIISERRREIKLIKRN